MKKTVKIGKRPGKAKGLRADCAESTEVTESAHSVEDFRSLIEGVIAAPVAEDRDAWLQLVPAEARRKLRGKLIEAEQHAREDEKGLRSSYEDSTPAIARVDLVRGQMLAHKLDLLIVPSQDRYNSEYAPECFRRLSWLTGFTGSLGMAVVMQEKAALFVDGRYTLQAADETDTAVFEQRHLRDYPPSLWIAEQIKVKPGARVGYDSWVHTQAELAPLADAVVKAGGVMVPCSENLIDKVWEYRPAEPISPIVVRPLRYAGKPSSAKRAELAKALVEQNCDAVVITSVSTIAWLLNIRGGDVAHTPLPLSAAIANADGTVNLFCDPLKVTGKLQKQLGRNVEIYEDKYFRFMVKALGFDKKRVMADPKSVPCAVFDHLANCGAEIVKADNPCQVAQACLNEVEIEGMRQAHRRDGAALTTMLAHLKRTAGKRGFAPVTEMQVAEDLRLLRRQFGQGLFRDTSFATIAGAADKGAIVHYQSTEKTNSRLKSGTLFLLDSGAQYLDGTTDVTRTLAIERPTAEMKDRFTRVLKGHIMLARARFPVGTSGARLDTLARYFLWQAGLDYDHGTGHGVGSNLGVHDGPQRISFVAANQEIKPGMVLSNEPGYYKTGEYGIRIENLVLVVEAGEISGGQRKMLAFEDLTLAPIDLDLVEPSLMTQEEMDWLNAYHERVFRSIAPLVDAQTRAWLDYATRLLKSSDSRALKTKTR